MESKLTARLAKGEKRLGAVFAWLKGKSGDLEGTGKDNVALRKGRRNEIFGGEVEKNSHVGIASETKNRRRRVHRTVNGEGIWWEKEVALKPNEKKGVEQTVRSGKVGYPLVKDMGTTPDVARRG